MKLERLFLGIALGAPGLAADITVMEQIIAKVNGDIITRSEIDRSRRQLEQEMKARGLTASNIQETIKDREKDFLRDRIDHLLLVQKGKELSISVDNEVSKWLAEIQKSSKIADPEKFQQFIKEQTGMSFEDFKSETRNNMLTQRVIRQEVGSRINVPRAEVVKYYEEHKQDFLREERVFLRELLLAADPKDPKATAEAEKKAKDLVVRARKGEKFFELARDNSQSETAANGGELPPFKKGELMKQIEDLVWEKDRGFVTDPIKIPNGFLIVRVEEHQRAGQAQLEEIENEIMERLYAPKMQPAIREYLTKLRSDAFLEIRDGYVDSAAAPGKSTKWTDPAQLRPETVTKEEVASSRRRRLLFIPIPGTSVSKSKSR
jgi:parvulin-like peptidyl-prolyl isomerase